MQINCERYLLSNTFLFVYLNIALTGEIYQWVIGIVVFLINNYENSQQ